jgi:hypothetical protein
VRRVITLKLKPFSINAMFCRDKRHKTIEAQEWSCSVLVALALKENKKKLKELRQHFDPMKHVYKVDLTFFYPKHVLYRKDGGISARAHDLSNVEKPLIDLVFLPMFYDRPSPYGAKNLNIDDKYIIDLRSRKRVGKDFRIRVTLNIKDLPRN